jgi:hypothetical protein
MRSDNSCKQFKDGAHIDEYSRSQFPEFWALVRPPEEPKKRKCLACGDAFKTTAGRRLCARHSKGATA